MTNNMTQFKEWLLARYKNKNTAKSYYYTVKKFLDQYEISEENINKYASTLIDKAISTQNQFIKSIRAYLAFSNIKINTPKYSKPYISEHNYITEEQLNKKILPKIYNLFKHNLRIICTLKFLFYTGVRRNEFLSLKRVDINLDKKTATVRGTKGKKDRKVHISKKVIKDLRAYFAIEAETQGAFNITDEKLNYIMSTINNEKIFDFKIHPHLFRHSCAKDMLKRGVSIAVIQKILGHTNIDTTMLYVDPDENMVKEMYHKFMD